MNEDKDEKCWEDKNSGNDNYDNNRGIKDRDGRGSVRGSVRGRDGSRDRHRRHSNIDDSRDIIKNDNENSSNYNQDRNGSRDRYSRHSNRDDIELRRYGFLPSIKQERQLNYLWRIYSYFLMYLYYMWRIVL
jgi:hypothetical protein